MLCFGNKNREIVAYARFLAEEFFSNMPPNVIEKRHDQQDKAGARVAQRRFETALDDVVSHVKHFKQEKKLRVFGKAKLHFEFSERLKSLGYGVTLAEEVNHYVMMRTP